MQVASGGDGLIEGTSKVLAIIGKRSFLDAADVLDVAELGEMGQSSGFAAHMLCTD